MVYFHSPLYGQQFNAGLIAGFNASQIDGDKLAGYDKLGLTGGIKSIYQLNDRMELSLELLYSMRGSQSDINSSAGLGIRKLHLDYLSLPLLYTYKDWYQQENDYYRIHFSAGFSFGRLFNYAVRDFEFEIESGNGTLQKNDFSIIADIAYYTGPHWAFSFRYNRSLNNLYTEIDEDQAIFIRLKGYFLSLRCMYIF